MNTIKSNRKTTKGRNIYYQSIPLRDENGDPILNQMGQQKVKTIKHVQETSSGIQRKISLFEFREKIELNKAKWHEQHPEYKRKIS